MQTLDCCLGASFPVGKKPGKEMERGCGSGHQADCPLENIWVLLSKVHELGNVAAAQL